MQRRVAIKRLPLPRSAQRGAAAGATALAPRDSGLAEARTAALLNHPDIVTVHEWDTDSDEAFLIMEHVDGASLADLLDDDGALDLDEAAAVLDAVFSAVEFAHENGVLHLDLKPQNVLVSRDGRVKVADLGISALSTAAGHATSYGGTPGYMPPEQIRGEPVDERTDVWALGALAFELLTNANPFISDSAEGALFKIEVAEPSAPSDFDHGLPPEIDDVVMTALAPAPGGPLPVGDALRGLAHAAAWATSAPGRRGSRARVAGTRGRRHRPRKSARPGTASDCGTGPARTRRLLAPRSRAPSRPVGWRGSGLSALGLSRTARRRGRRARRARGRARARRSASLSASAVLGGTRRLERLRDRRRSCSCSRPPTGGSSRGATPPQRSCPLAAPVLGVAHLSLATPFLAGFVLAPAASRRSPRSPAARSCVLAWAASPSGRRLRQRRLAPAGEPARPRTPDVHDAPSAERLAARVDDAVHLRRAARVGARGRGDVARVPTSVATGRGPRRRAGGARAVGRLRCSPGRSLPRADLRSHFSAGKQCAKPSLGR